MVKNNTPVHRRRGDRKDGRRLRSLAPFYNFTPFIMKERGDASNYFTDSVDTAAADAYLREKREQGLKGIGMLHLFIAAYVRCVAQFPALNRFISGQRIYARNDIEIVMTIKKRLSIDAGETSFKVVIDPTDRIDDIFAKMSIEIDKIKADTGDNKTENVAAAFSKFPRFFFRFIICIIRFLDYYGLLPQSLIDASPFHGSLVITDLGSLGIPPIYHHLYNFGNVPIFIAFGAKHKQSYTRADGTTEDRRYIDYTVVTDERICDGHYYATAFKYMTHYLRNPQLLDEPIAAVRDID